MKFSEKDIDFIANKGIDIDIITDQINKFKAMPPFAPVTDKATPGNGIISLEDEDQERILNLYSEAKDDGRLSKFVPASGAATRMFRDLEIYYRSNNERSENIAPEVEKSVTETMTGIKKFPFYNDLKEILSRSGEDIGSLRNKKDFKTLIGYILYDKGLGYNDTPKAFIKFTSYKNRSKTSFEEQVDEGVRLFADKNGKVRIHFTLSGKYIPQARKMVEEIQRSYKEHSLEISFSVQKSSTDTIAVEEQNSEPLRDDNGMLLFRPGGHGALIENLNDLDDDIVLIKNIDNIMNLDHMKLSDKFNKLLTGKLIDLRSQINSYLDIVDNDCGPDVLQDIEEFLKKNFFIDTKIFEGDNRGKTILLKKVLDRPLRLCGMIKNTGEPGGGPFFTSADPYSPLQIVESSQIDMNNKKHFRIFKNSTHFNPVNLVCSLKDRKGVKYNLKKFVDENAYFTSSKTYKGKKIKALELPGLWNGAMSGWLTAFAEIPLQMFSPAKKVNDLLKPERFEK